MALKLLSFEFSDVFHFACCLQLARRISLERRVLSMTAGGDSCARRRDREPAKTSFVGIQAEKPISPARLDGALRMAAARTLAKCGSNIGNAIRAVRVVGDYIGPKHAFDCLVVGEDIG
jgi:hypothetical protein